MSFTDTKNFPEFKKDTTRVDITNRYDWSKKQIEKSVSPHLLKNSKLKIFLTVFVQGFFNLWMSGVRYMSIWNNYTVSKRCNYIN